MKKKDMIEKRLDKIDELKKALVEIGSWENKGDSVADTYDFIYGAGAWKKLLDI